MAYEERRYRRAMHAAGLVSFQVMVRETDLWISAEADLSEEARQAVRRLRRGLEQYARGHPGFLESLEPLDVEAAAPPLVRAMAEAGRAAGVGPMAAVAGALAEFVGRELTVHSSEVIVENGGDLFVRSARPRTVAVHAGASAFSGKVGIRLPAGTAGVCTSSGTVGHSLSLGRADAVTVVADSAALADACATAAGNRVAGPDRVQAGLDLAASVPGVRGVLILAGEAMGAWGEIELVGL